MNITGNTILITGGSSGIGRGLAEAFHALGNQVVITGRRWSALEKVTAACPGMSALPLNVGDQQHILEFAETARRTFPGLNVLINNAGVQWPEDLRGGKSDLQYAEEMVATNLLGPILLTQV